MTKEKFELHKSIVDWLVQNGICFHDALNYLAYSIKSDISIAEAYIKISVLRERNEYMKVPQDHREVLYRFNPEHFRNYYNNKCDKCRNYADECNCEK